MYRFKLEAFLNYRRHQEEVCQKELAQIERQLTDEREKLNRLKEDKQENTQTLQAKQKIHINISVIILSVNYIRQLAKDIEKQADCVRVATRKVNQKRSKLVMIVKKRKSLEKLKEKGQPAVQQKMNPKGGKLKDEIAPSRHSRKM